MRISLASKLSSLPFTTDTDSLGTAPVSVRPESNQAISVGKRPDDGCTEAQITYRFGPPPSEAGPDQSSVGPFKNGSRS